MNSDVIQKISNMTQPTEKRTWRKVSPIWWLILLGLAVLFVTLGYIGFGRLIEEYRGLKEILLEGGPKGAILSLLVLIVVLMVVLIIGLRRCIALLTLFLKVKASLKEGNTEKILKDMKIFSDSIQSPAADPSDSDQSFYIKLPEPLSLAQRIEIFCNKLRKTFSLRGDNSISGNNSAGASVEDITKSAKKDDKEVQYNLGLMCYKGKGAPQDYEKAIEWFTKSAEQGDARAQFSLGWMYAEEKGTPQDDKQAVHWYTKSAEQGERGAQNNLGVMYDNGRGVPAR